MYSSAPKLNILEDFKIKSAVINKIPWEGLQICSNEPKTKNNYSANYNPTQVNESSPSYANQKIANDPKLLPLNQSKIPKMKTESQSNPCE